MFQLVTKTKCRYTCTFIVLVLWGQERLFPDASLERSQGGCRGITWPNVSRTFKEQEFRLRKNCPEGQDGAKSQEWTRIQTIAWIVLPYIAWIQSSSTWTSESLILPLFPKVQLQKLELQLISALGVAGFSLQDKSLYTEFFVKEENKKVMEK